MNLKCLLAIAALVIGADSLCAQRYVGGDISMLTKYEAAGCTYLDKDSATISGDLISYLKKQGWNSMRVRLFVDPSQASSEHRGQGVCQDLDYVKVLGKRIKDAGLKFLLDIHYSDTWTDPDQHSTPASWSADDAEAKATSCYTYTNPKVG